MKRVIPNTNRIVVFSSTDGKKWTDRGVILDGPYFMFEGPRLTQGGSLMTAGSQGGHLGGLVRHNGNHDLVDEPVIVICMTGHRSPMVAYQLKKRGYRQVYNLTWGMLAWKLWYCRYKPLN